MNLTPHQKIELLAGLLVAPTVGTAAWSVGLRLAGAVLWLLWVGIVALYVIGRIERPTTVPAPSVPASPTPSVPPPTDPARALLDALGTDLTGGNRS